VTRPQRHPKHRLQWMANLAARWFAANPLIAWLRGAATLSATLTIVALSYLKFADGFDLAAYPLLGWIAARKAGVFFALVLTQSVCQILGWLLGRFERHDLNQIHKALDRIAAKHFPGADLGRHPVRVTLFKRRSLWPLGCWLGAVERSGENYRRLRSIFSVSDSIESENTGVAGRCYWTGRTLCLGVDPVDEGGDATDYKNKTYLTGEEYDRLSLKSCFFLATCIKVDGKKWGVLVLDTTDPHAAPKSKTMENRRRQELEHATELLATLLR